MKPLLFNTEMVRALLEDRKTVTRRVVKEPWYIDNEEVCRVSGLAMHRGTRVTDGMPYPDAPYRPGDILYVRETWGNYSYDDPESNAAYYLYRADYEPNAKGYWYEPEHIHFCDFPRWRPSIHMPKEAARLFLRVTGVRVEKLQDITISEMQREGIRPKNINPRKRGDGCSCAWEMESCKNEPCPNRDAYEYECMAAPFSEAWDSTTKKADLPRYGWEANPWVWVIEFERISREDATSGGQL